MIETLSTDKILTVSGITGLRIYILYENVSLSTCIILFIPYYDVTDISIMTSLTFLLLRH